MWKAEATATTHASPQSVWDIWADVPRWNQWDPDVLSSRLEGPFEQGTRGGIRPRGGPPTTFELQRVRQNLEFTMVTSLPLARLVFVHRLEACIDGTRVTHRIELRGLLGSMFGRLIGANLARGLPDALSELIRLAEGRLGATSRAG